MWTRRGLCAESWRIAPRPATVARAALGVGMQRIDAAIAIVVRDNKVLVCQRKQDDTFGGYWEFPGGKQEEGETLEECLARELAEELSIRARPVIRLTVIEHDYPHGKLRLHPFLCEHEHGEVMHLECQASQWIDP